MLHLLTGDWPSSCARVAALPRTQGPRHVVVLIDIARLDERVCVLHKGAGDSGMEWIVWQWLGILAMGHHGRRGMLAVWVGDDIWVDVVVVGRDIVALRVVPRHDVTVEEERCRRGVRAVGDFSMPGRGRINVIQGAGLQGFEDDRPVLDSSSPAGSSGTAMEDRTGGRRGSSVQRYMRLARVVAAQGK